MRAISLTIDTRGSQSLAPVSGTDLVRYQDLNAGLSGCAPLVHVHTSAQITDFDAAVVELLVANGVPLSGTGTVSLLPGGGLQWTGSQLGINSGVVSFVGHHHVASDIDDLAAAVLALLAANVTGSSTIGVSGTGPVSLGAIVQPHGGILSTPSGLGIDSGIVSLVGHTHAQLHDPVTLAPSTSIAASLAGQQLSMEVLVQPGGGLMLTPSGVAVDPAVVPLSGTGGSTALSVLNTATLQLNYAGGVLSGVVPLDASPPSGSGGRIIAGVNGLRVALGTDGQSAAAGNHVHSVATASSDGFMSATDKAHLDALVGGTPLSGVNVVDTQTLNLFSDGVNLSGTVLYELAPPANSGRGRIAENANGLYVVLGADSTSAAAGNHLHDTRYPVLASGTLTLYPGDHTAPVNPSGVAAWFKAVVGGTTYRIPLYQ